MESKRFAEIFECLHEKEMDLLSLKGQDYATEDERLENFIQAAGVLHQRPSQITLEYFTKHFIAVINEVAKESGDLVWSYVINGEVKEGFIQKICDARNYLGLLLCCLEQERGTTADFGQVTGTHLIITSGTISAKSIIGPSRITISDGKSPCDTCVVYKAECKGTEEERASCQFYAEAQQ